MSVNILIIDDDPDIRNAQADTIEIFDEHLKTSEAQAKRRDGRFAVLFIDLDNFKLLNDHFGHAAGDNFLITASTGMKNILCDADIIARLGGDEFAAILTDISIDFEPEITAQRILDTIQDLPLPEAANFSITSSIGIAIYPDDSNDVEQLVKMADQAMYYAKQSGKNSIKKYISIGSQS